MPTQEPQKLLTYMPFWPKEPLYCVNIRTGGMWNHLDSDIFRFTKVEGDQFYSFYWDAYAEACRRKQCKNHKSG